MKRKLSLIICILLVSAPLICSADGTATVSEIKGVCKTFLQSIRRGDYNGAFSYLQNMPNSISDQQFSELTVSIIQQSKTINNLYGQASGFILVEEKNVSDTALKLVYLMLRENLPIRWKFIYYKPAQEWKLVSIEFDDKLEEVF